MKIAYIGPITLDVFEDAFQEHFPATTKSQVYVPMLEEVLRLGHQLTICTTSSVIKKSFYAKHGNLEIFVAPVSSHGRVRAFTKFAQPIMRISAFLKKNPCDIYHAHWTYEFALAALKVDPTRTLITIRDCPELIYDYFKDYYRKKRLEMAQEVFRKGKFFSGNSPYILEEVKKYHSELSAVVVPNMVTDAKDYGLVPQRHNIVSVNNGFDGRKNVATLMQAFAIMKKEIPDLQLKLYGNGYEPDGLAFQWAKEHGLDDGIVFCGHQTYDTVCQAMANSGILVHPSLEESFGMTLVEAMSYGAVVVAGEKSGAVPWVLNEGKAGALTDVTSPQAIAQTVLRLYDKQEDWDAYVKAGYERIKDFSAEYVTNEFLCIYQNIIEKQSVK